ncbi:C16orf86 isoform 2 [Pan troglodytes]|uniref:Chromosome 16 open reading frame 86 n=3 Tax=Hominidae TaxID=9604 RepID=F8WFD6_HUMAN|nr:hypothetical protein KI723_161189 [Homo sapiens]KAI4055589.1 hypothetical protein G5576_013327 [Homo sapiens]PNI91183.1 C16orf86 isoform 2 [Pan troglodytes]PNJ61326.1 C16orf86 isoform 4 [Pongo abelii]
MASAGAERRPGVQEATVVGQGQLTEEPGSAQTSEVFSDGSLCPLPGHGDRWPVCHL